MTAGTRRADCKNDTKRSAAGISRREFSVGAASIAALAGAGVPLDDAAASSDDALIYQSASELLELFKAKKLSPVAVLEAQIKQTASVGKQVNCFTYTHIDEAMAAAKESEKRYAAGNPRALEGITVALKDEYDKVGWITTAGSKLLKDNVATKNHPAVDCPSSKYLRLLSVFNKRDSGSSLVSV